MSGQAQTVVGLGNAAAGTAAAKTLRDTYSWSGTSTDGTGAWSAIA